MKTTQKHLQMLMISAIAEALLQKDLTRVATEDKDAASIFATFEMLPRDCIKLLIAVPDRQLRLDGFVLSRR